MSGSSHIQIVPIGIQCWHDKKIALHHPHTDHDIDTGYNNDSIQIVLDNNNHNNIGNIRSISQNNQWWWLNVLQTDISKLHTVIKNFHSIFNAKGL